MRDARVRQTSEERVARRRENAGQMRAARARQSSVDRSSRRQENVNRMRAIRRPPALLPDWTRLPVHRQPSPAAICLGPNHQCSHCGTRLLCRETETFCCRDGKVAITPLPALPEGWEQMFQSRDFRTHSRTYNNLFAFTAMGVSGDQGFVHQPVPRHSRTYNNLFAFTAMGVSGDQGFVHQPVPSCVNIHGRTYHRVLPAEMRGPVHWYVHDPDQRREGATNFSVDHQLVDAIQQTLATINPYAKSLRQLGQEPAKDVSLHVEWKEESREIAAIIRVDSDATRGPRTVVFWRRSQLAPTFISPLNALSETLQYPLFFPHGTNGWFPQMTSVRTPFAKITQLEHYRHRVLTEARFGLLGRLLNEYLVDMFSSVEDSRPNYIRQNVQTRIHPGTKPSMQKVDPVPDGCIYQLPSWDHQECKGS